MNKIIILVLVFSFFNCKKNQLDNSKNNAKQVVFIISNNSNKVITSIFENITYKNLNDKNHHFTKKENDTIRLNLLEGNQLYVSTKYSYQDTIFVTNIDTVRIDFRHNNYLIKSTNKFSIKPFERNKQIDNLESNFIKVSYKFPMEMQSTDYIKLKSIYPLKVDFEKIKKDKNGINLLTNLLKLDLIKGLSYYDSLKNQSSAQNSFLKTQKENLKIYYFKKALLLYKLSFNENVQNFLLSDVFINPKLNENNFGYQFIYNIMTVVILQNETISLGSKDITDFKKIIPFLPKYFKGKNLEFAQILCLKNAVEEQQSKQSLRELITYYKLIKTTNYFDAFVKKIESDNALMLTNFDDNQFVLLQDNKIKINLKEILNKNINKVVYIDFWASWCAPCREAIPSSKKLQQEFKDKNIKFVFISIDKSFEAWQKASINEELIQNNYLGLNINSSKFTKKLNLISIPRYIIFNKKGMLVNTDAPSPSSIEIRKELNKYLAE